MSLSDLMGAMRLAVWPQIALVLFLLLFAGVLVYAFGRSRQGTFDRARRLPLGDEAEHE
jgi:cbb3-type cytochrome oxidase subunit 3